MEKDLINDAINCSISQDMLNKICDSSKGIFKSEYRREQYLENKIAAYALKGVLESHGINCWKPILYDGDPDQYMNHCLRTDDVCLEVRSTGIRSGFLIVSSKTWHISKKDGNLTSRHSSNIDAFIAINLEKEHIYQYLKDDTQEMINPKCYIMGVLEADRFKKYLVNDVPPMLKDSIIPDTRTKLDADSYLFPYEEEGTRSYSGVASDHLTNVYDGLAEFFHVNFKNE